MSLESDYPELFGAFKHVVPNSVKIYLVGGAVRDELLGIAINDFDFVSEGLVRPIGKKMANEMNGRYYVLDDDREMVRVIVNYDLPDSYNIDIAQISSDTIESDLLERDFTINAIALEFLNRDRIIDPLGGVTDLRKKKLRMCSSHSLMDDPLRSVRAIRLALEFDLRMDEELVRALSEMRPQLFEASFERYRDELFKTIRTYRLHTGLELYQRFNFLDFLFPGFDEKLLPPTIDFTRETESLVQILTLDFDEEKSGNLYAGYSVLKVGEYRPELKEFYDGKAVLYHTFRMLLIFSGCLFPHFAGLGKKFVNDWMKNLVLGRDEMECVDMNLEACAFLQQQSSLASWNDLDTYHYFLKYHGNGIGGCILYMNSVMLSEENPQKFEKWQQACDLLSILCCAWFRKHAELVEPEAYLSGDQICEVLNVQPGKLIGEIKKQLLDRQVMKEITSVESAEDFCKTYDQNARSI